MGRNGGRGDGTEAARRRARASLPGPLALPVVLVGLMGAGKSSVGHRLADLLRVPFRDSDAEIERAAGMSVADIFETYGEGHFRDGERRVIARLLSGEPLVLATGGGAFMNAETRALIAELAVSVWLAADLDVLVSRTAGRSHRPILNRGNPRDILARLMDERYPVYAEADCRVESLGDQTHETMARRIAEALAEHEAETGRAVFAEPG